MCKSRCGCTQMLNSCRDLEKLSKGPCLSFSAFIVLDMLVGKSDGPYTYDYGNNLRPVMATPGLETPVSLWGLQPLPQIRRHSVDNQQVPSNLYYSFEEIARSCDGDLAVWDNERTTLNATTGLANGILRCSYMPIPVRSHFSTSCLLSSFLKQTTLLMGEVFLPRRHCMASQHFGHFEP